MLYTIVFVLFALWLVGMATAFVAGGLIHLLIVAAVIIAIYQFLRGRKAG